MKRLLCKLGFHSWSAWHRKPSPGVTASRSSSRGDVVFHPRRPYRLMRYCYDCPKKEWKFP